MGCTYERKCLAGTNCVGCTCDRKEFRQYNCIFISTVRISVFERSPVAHDLILPSVCARRAYPRRFLGHVGRTLLSPTLTWQHFQMPSRKAIKNRLFSTDAYQCVVDCYMVYLVEDYMFRSIMLFNTPMILSMIIICE